MQKDPPQAEPAILPAELGRQLMKPAGEIGLVVGEKMNVANEQLYDLVLSQLDLSPVQRLLEVGFGNGKFLRRFFAANPSLNVWGVDFSQTMCDAAAASHADLIASKQLHLLCQDAATLPWEDGFFDTAITLNTVYFWPSIAGQAAEFHRVLRTGGRLLIGYRTRSAMDHFPFTQEVFALYEPDELRAAFERSGFRFIDDVIHMTNLVTLDGTSQSLEDRCLVLER